MDYSYDQVMSALRAADAAGNTDDARRLAQIAKGMGAAAPSAPTGPDESFGSAFSQGIDAPLENLGMTAEALGFNKTGKFLRQLTAGPGANYKNATDDFINKGNDGFHWESLPRAAVEQGGQLLGSLITRAGGSAAGGLIGSVVPGVGNAAGAAAGAFAGPALFGALQTVGPVALERAQHNGREAPNSEDWQAAIMVAGASGALDAYGIGKLFKGGGLTGNIVREGVTEGAQSLVEQAGSTVGTKDGADIDPKQALGEAILGGTTSGGAHAAGKVAASPVALARAIQAAPTKAEYKGSMGTDLAASDLRVMDLLRGEMEANGQWSSGRENVPTEHHFNKVQQTLDANISDLVRTMDANGVLDADAKEAVGEALKAARNTRRDLAMGGGRAAYLQTEMDRLQSSTIPAEFKAPLMDSIRDLNTVSHNRFATRKSGPLESFGRKAGGAAVAAAGLAAAGPAGLAAGMVGPHLGGAIGRVADRALGIQELPVVKRARLAAKYAPTIQRGDGAQGLKDALDAARAVRVGQEAVAQQQRADFRQSVQDLVAQDVVPPGGIYQLIHQQTGMRPQAVQAGLNALLAAGQTDAETVRLFNEDPQALMQNNRGLTLINKLVGQQSQNQAVGAGLPPQGQGTSPQGPQTPQGAQGTPQAVPATLVAPQGPQGPVATPQGPGEGIRNPIAYKATVDAALATHGAIQANPNLPEPVKAAGAEIAQAKTRGEKLTILNNFLGTLPANDRGPASMVLMPLTGYGPKDGPLSSVLRAPGKAQEAPQASAASHVAPQASEAPQGPANAAGPAPFPTDPRSIRVRGDKLIVSDDSFRRIKADKKQRQALKATGFKEVTTRDGSQTIKL